jgi:hypothetical protein
MIFRGLIVRGLAGSPMPMRGSADPATTYRHPHGLIISPYSTARSRRAGAVLRFIEASFWANPRPDGRLHLDGAYSGAPDLTAHAVLTARAVLNK